MAELEKLEHYLDFGIEMSHVTAGKTVSTRVSRAHQLYNRLTVTCMSMIRLMPSNRYFPVEWEFWDFFSVASLTRNLIENYFNFFYIGVDTITPIEEDLRILIFNYHQNREKYKIYKLFNAPQDALNEFEINLPSAEAEIKSNAYFQTLPTRIQQQIIRGEKFLYLNRSQIASRFNFSSQEIEPLYKLFSNHTHSSPLSFFTMSNERGRGLENQAEVDYMTMALQVASKYLSAAIIDMTLLFPESVSKLDPIKLKIVKAEIYNT